MLLNALISHDVVRAEILPQLPPEASRQFVTREILEALTHMTGGSSAFSALEGRLSSAGQALLHDIVAADEMIDDEQAMDQARACLRRLEMDLKKRQVDELRGRVKAAEREGRVDEALV